MRQFYSFVVKEFYHIVRDRYTLGVIIGIPVIQILLFGFAINMEVQDVRLAVYEPMSDAYTRGIIDRFRHNPYFEYHDEYATPEEIQKALRRGELDMALLFEPHFQDDLVAQGSASVQVLANCAEPNRGTISANYAAAIIAQYQLDQAGISEIPFQIRPEVRMVYNPQMKSSYLFVPGIMGLVLMIISTTMTSVSLVREKERGTLEVLLASPLKRGTMIFAKTIPYLILSLANLCTILVLSYFVLGVPIRGSLLLILLISVLYIFLSLAYGLLISSAVSNQINASIFSNISVMVPTLIFSGMIFAINMLPWWLRWFSYIVPARWYISAIRKVMIQGLGFGAVWQEVSILVLFCLVLLVATMALTKPRLQK